MAAVTIRNLSDGVDNSDLVVGKHHAYQNRVFANYFGKAARIEPTGAGRIMLLHIQQS